MTQLHGMRAPLRPVLSPRFGNLPTGNIPGLPEPLKPLLQQVPKTELHLHLSGSTPIELVRTFLREQGWDETRIAEHTRLKERYADLNDFLDTYLKVAYHVKTPEQFRRATVAIIQEAARDNVRYLEIRSSILSRGDETTSTQIVDAIEAGMHEGEAWVRQTLGFEIKTGLIVLAERAKPPELSLESARLAVDFAKRPGSRIIGFDLGGSETGHPVTLHAPAFRYVKKHGLPLTLHAGETAYSGTMSGTESIKKALRLGADRIGHGLQSISDSKLLKRVVKQGIPLEVCPDSNVKISEVPSYDVHPLPQLMQVGANVSLNSDNRMITPINLTDQLGRLYAEGLLTCWEQLKTLSLNGVRAGFMPSLDKKRLEKQFKTEFKRLEAQFQSVIRQFFCRQCDHQPDQQARPA